MSALETKQRLEQELIEAGAAEHLTTDNVKRLAPALIIEHPELFQQRRPPEHVTRAHVEDLSKTPRDGTALASVVVFPVGKRWVLLDGHHRMSAYRKAGWRKEVPVTVFTGTLDEAIARANQDNHRAILSMTTAEKMSAAWRMVCMTKLTAEKIRRATGASMRSIASMRKARDLLLSKQTPLSDLIGMSWRKADAAAREEPAEVIDWDEADEQEAKDLANKLVKVFGKRLHYKHQVIAMALEAYDSRLPDTLRELWDAERGRIETEEEEVEF